MVVAVGAVFGVMTALLYGRQRLRLKQRGVSTEAEFVEMNSDRGLDPSLLSAISGVLQDGMMVRSARIDLSDDLGAVYGLYGDDLDDAVREVARRCDLVLPSPTELESREPVKTVNDLIQLLANLPRVTHATS